MAEQGAVEALADLVFGGDGAALGVVGAVVEGGGAEEKGAGVLAVVHDAVGAVGFELAAEVGPVVEGAEGGGADDDDVA